MAAAPDRSPDLSRAISDRHCNLIQLGSRVKHAAGSDGEGAVLSPGADEAEDVGESWEARALRESQVPREEMGLILTLEAGSSPVGEALDPGRVLDRLDKLLYFHGLEYLDSLVLEIPGMRGGEEQINTYRRETGAAVRRALEGVVAKAGDRISRLGFSWESNPHTPYPGREPDSPLSDVMELRDMVIPSTPIVAMFPVGLGCGVTEHGSIAALPRGTFSLAPEEGVFQIGTRVLHGRRADGRPFRFVDVNPRPMEEIMADLKGNFNMAIHLEAEYAKRFENRAQAAGDGSSDTSTGDELQGPLPEKADVSWAHILVQHQHRLQGLDEWEMIRDTQIKPSVNRAVKTLREAGKATGEWGFIYRSTLGSLLSTLTEVQQVRKKDQLAEATALMDRLCPSLEDISRGMARQESSQGATDAGASVMGRCVGAALATGVDCVLAEEFASSREAGREHGFQKVGDSDSLKQLYAGFKLPA